MSNQEIEQQIELRNQNGTANDGQDELTEQEHMKLQRMTSTEEREDRRKMREIFDSLDVNNDGVLNIRELKDYIRRYPCRNLPEQLANNILKMSDKNNDGLLDFEEFYQMSRKFDWLFKRMMHKYCQLIVPNPRRTQRAEIDTMAMRSSVSPALSFESIDGAYEHSMSICPPPLTMIIFSIVEIIMFFIDIVYLSDDPRNIKAVGESVNGPAATLFIYSPYKRVESWRFITYMFVHVGVMHIVMNLIVQIFLGVALELVHQWWRISLVYLAGVLAGSMGTSIASPGVFLAGASGGVYALITAHIATIILNWTEMRYAVVQLFIFLLFCVTDVSSAIYHHLNDQIHDQVGYVAHLSGAVAGILVGIGVLRNLKVRAWEQKLWWCAITLYFLLMLSGISVHIFYQDHFAHHRS